MTDPARSWFFHPDWTSDNPYQRLLYGGLDGVGVRAVPVTDLMEHLVRRAQERDPGVVHLHWTSLILQNCPGPFSAYLALHDFMAAMDEFLASGGRLVWTIHNVLPHDDRYRWAEQQLAAYLAAHASLVHVLTDSTLDAIGDLYPVDPAKVVVVEHSSYLGVYPDEVSRAAARLELGLDPGDKVLLALGGIRPYKGLARLVDVFEELHLEDPSLRLLVAGRMGYDSSLEGFRERCLAHPAVIPYFDFVPVDRLQVWARAADLAVLPYQAILNSGAFWLAQTFGLPLVGPRGGALLRWEARSHIRLFEPGAAGSLAEVLRGAVRDLVDDPELRRRARQDATDLAYEQSPEAMGREFADLVRGRLLSRLHDG